MTFARDYLQCPKVFFQYGIHDSDLSDFSYEDFLVADRPGLKHLRDKIDEVLSGADEVTFESEMISDLNGIRVATYTGDPSPNSEASERLAMIGCIAIFAVGLILVSLGAWKLWELVAQH